MFNGDRQSEPIDLSGVISVRVSGVGPRMNDRGIASFCLGTIRDVDDVGVQDFDGNTCVRVPLGEPRQLFRALIVGVVGVLLEPLSADRAVDEDVNDLPPPRGRGGVDRLSRTSTPSSSPSVATMWRTCRRTSDRWPQRPTRRWGPPDTRAATTWPSRATPPGTRLRTKRPTSSSSATGYS